MKQKRFGSILLLMIMGMFSVSVQGQTEGRTENAEKFARTEYVDNGKVVFRSSVSDNEIRLFSSKIDEVWKNTYRYAVIVPKDASLKSYSTFMDILKGDTFTPGNTLVICCEESEKQTKEAAEGFPVLVLNNRLIETGYITSYSIEKKKKGGYNYILTAMTEYK